MSWFLGKKKTVGELLFAAAHDGDHEAVEKHWANAKSSDLEYVNEKGYYLHHGFTPLMIAASMGHARIVKMFIELEANINHVDSHHGWTPLIEAAGNDHLSVVQLLIDEPGLKVNAQDTMGKTALHWAAAHNRVEILKLLLAHPMIEVNLRDGQGKIAEDIATSGEAYKLFCVNRGVDPAALDATIATSFPASALAAEQTTTPTTSPITIASGTVSAEEHAALQERVNKLEKTVMVLATHLAKANNKLMEHIAATDLRFAEMNARINNQVEVEGAGVPFAESVDDDASADSVKFSEISSPSV